MNKTAAIIFYFLLLGALTVAAKSRRVTKFHKVPLYRSLEQLEDITTDMLEDEPKVPSKSKVFLVKPRKTEADEGRFFKHVLLFKTLLQPSSSNVRPGYYPGYYPPYVIIGNPLGNLTNINNNTLINTVTPPPAAAAAAAAFSPTTTTTATAGTGTGTAGGGVGGRIVYIRDSQALPYPMPTPVYQQRQQEMPEVIYSQPFNGGNQNQNKRRRNRFGNGNGNGNANVYRNPNRKSNNPFSTFANRLRKVQFF